MDDWLLPCPGCCKQCCRERWGACSFFEYDRKTIHAKSITPDARLDEAQAGIKIAGRIVSKLRDADDTTLMAESREEL